MMDVLLLILGLSACALFLLHYTRPDPLRDYYLERERLYREHPDVNWDTTPL